MNIHRRWMRLSDNFRGCGISGSLSGKDSMTEVSMRAEASAETAQALEVALKEAFSLHILRNVMPNRILCPVLK